MKKLGLFLMIFLLLTAVISSQPPTPWQFVQPSAEHILFYQLLKGLLRLNQNPLLALKTDQKQKILPALEKAAGQDRQVMELREKMKTLLTKRQVIYLETLKKAGKLSYTPGFIPPPGEDPLMVEVKEILKKKARLK